MIRHALLATLSYLTPRVGRFTATQIRQVAELLKPPGYLAVGPVLILVDLPERLRARPEAVSIEEINALLRAAEASN